MLRLFFPKENGWLCMQHFNRTKQMRLLISLGELKGSPTNSLRNKEIKNYHHPYHLQWVIYHSCSSPVSCSNSEWLQQIQLDSWPQEWEIMCFWWSLSKHGDGMFVIHVAELLPFYHRQKKPLAIKAQKFCGLKINNVDIAAEEAADK